MTPLNHHYILRDSKNIIKTMIRKKIKIFSFVLFLGCSFGAHAGGIEVVESIPVEPIVSSSTKNGTEEFTSLMESKRIAQGAAVLDSVSTRLAILKGGSELNPLVNTSPVGLAALAVGRIALMEYADANLTEEEKAKQFPVSAAISVGAVINNALVLGTSITPLGLIGAAAGGLALWQYYQERAKEELQKKNLAAANKQKNTVVFVEPVPVEPMPYYMGVVNSVAIIK